MVIIALLVFIVVQIIFIPLAIVGFILVAYKQGSFPFEQFVNWLIQYHWQTSLPLIYTVPKVL